MLPETVCNLSYDGQPWLTTTTLATGDVFMTERFVHDDLRQCRDQILWHADLELETQFTTPTHTAFAACFHDACTLT